MNVYSSASFDVTNLCAPLEVLNESADRIKLIQARCTDISTSCTQNCNLIFRYRLRNNVISKIFYKGMSDIADDRNITETILLVLYDMYCANYCKNTDTIKIS